MYEGRLKVGVVGGEGEFVRGREGAVGARTMVVFSCRDAAVELS
jgi:hypothetical protein